MTAPFQDVRRLAAEGSPAPPAATDLPGPGPDAPVVVLVLESPLEGSAWRDVAPRLARRVRVLAVPPPGTEAATPEAPGAPGAPGAAPVDAAGALALLEHERVHDAVVAGMGGGARAAAALAAEAPHRVRGLVLAPDVGGPPEEEGSAEVPDALRQFCGAVVLVTAGQGSGGAVAAVRDARPGAELVDLEAASGRHDVAEGLAGAVLRCVQRALDPARATVAPVPVHAGRTPRERLAFPDLVAGGYELAGLRDIHRAVVVRLRRTWDVPASQVWAALTAQPGLGAWFGSWSGTAGGAVHVTMAYEDEVVHEAATVHVCDPPHRLVVEWARDDTATDSATGAGQVPGEESWTVEVVLEPVRGGTCLTLVQLLPDGATARDVAMGWHWYVDRLGAYLGGRAPQSWEEARGALALLYG